MTTDDVCELITLAYVWLVDPNCTENIDVWRNLREKIITVYLITNLNMLICINYRVQSRYLTYCRLTLRNCHVRESESIYRVYHVEWNSVIAALLRSDEWCRLPCGTQSREPRLHEGLGEISCWIGTVIALRSARPMSRYKHSHCYLYILLDFDVRIFIQKERRLAIHRFESLKSQIAVLFSLS